MQVRIHLVGTFFIIFFGRSEFEIKLVRVSFMYSLCQQASAGHSFHSGQSGQYPEKRLRMGLVVLQ